MRVADVRTAFDVGLGIELDRVGVERDGHVVLHDVTCRLTARRIAVIGANGSGKSTFARLLNGLIEPTSGRVSVGGVDPAHDPRAVRRRVGFVFTDPQSQILMPTPREDLALSLRAGRGSTSGADVDARVVSTLEEYGLLHRADTPASALSGGQKQLLALAAVLITDPAVIVADEPTTLLDLRNARRIGDLLLSQDARVIVVTHDLELAARCDHALLFDDGALVAEGDPSSVIDRYRGLSG